MLKIPLLFIFFLSSYLTSCLYASDKPVKVFYKKPTPCHKLKKYLIAEGILRIYLESYEGLCAQVIAEEYILLSTRDVQGLNQIEIYVGGKLWKKKNLRE